MYKINFIVAVVIIAFGCNNGVDNQNAVVSGKLEGANNQLISLEKLTTKDIVFVDSVRTDEEGNYSFSKPFEEHAFYRIVADENNFVNFIAQPNDKITINANHNDMASTYQIDGTDEVKRMYNFHQDIKSLYRQNDSLTQVVREAQQSQNEEMYISATKAYEGLNGTYFSTIKTFIDAKPGSLSSLAALRNLDAEQDYDYYQKVAEGLTKEMPNSIYTQQLNQQLQDMKKLAVGAVAPDIALSTPEGKVLKLSDLRGKVVLVDFWAAWCKPCRMENPNVVRMYQKYKSKGFDVYGVSLDKDKESWVEAIKQDGLVWNHVSDLGYWNSAVVSQYEIKGIPLTYLLDKEGVIIGKNLRGQQLEQKLAEIFGS